MIEDARYQTKSRNEEKKEAPPTQTQRKKEKKKKKKKKREGVILSAYGRVKLAAEINSENPMVPKVPSF